MALEQTHSDLTDNDFTKPFPLGETVTNVFTNRINRPDSAATQTINIFTVQLQVHTTWKMKE